MVVGSDVAVAKLPRPAVTGETNRKAKTTGRDRRRPPDGPARWQIELAVRSEQARQRALSREAAGSGDGGIKRQCIGTGDDHPKP